MCLEKKRKILDFFKSIENKDFLSGWLINGVNIWPIVKASLDFEILRRKENRKFPKLKIFILTFLYRIKYRRSKNIPINTKKDFLFTGYPATRIRRGQVSMNKYFDPMMDYLEKINMSSLLVEFNANPKDNYYRKDRVFIGDNSLTKSKKNVSLDILYNLPFFNETLDNICQEFNLCKYYLIRDILISIDLTFIWRDFYSSVLEKIKPKMIFMLCYYSPQNFGLIIAARKLNIPTVDMQHGGQGEFHFAYSFSSKLASHELLPNYFWVWDKHSSKNLLSWLEKDRVILGGNPSHSIDNDSFVKKILKPNDILILYTLQKGIYPYVPFFLVDAIKKSPQSYKWWFRFHPRMGDNEKREVYTQIKHMNIFDRINFEDANKFSLSEILLSTKVHISSFSGSIIEAALCNVPLNITFSEIGAASFADLIKNGNLQFKLFKSNDSLNNLIKKTNLNYKDDCINDNLKFKNTLNYLLSKNFNC